MKTIVKHLKFLFFLLALGTFIASCSDDDGGDPDPDPEPEPTLSLTDFNPKTGLTGTEVTITGEGFGDDKSAVSVSFNGVDADVASVSDTEITVVVPEGASTGAISVTVGENTEEFTESFEIQDEADMTSSIENPSFEDQDAGGANDPMNALPVGWDLSHTELVWQKVNTDGDPDTKTGNNITGLWHGAIPDYQLSQTVTGLENGTYRVTADLFVGSTADASRLTTQRLFAGNKSQLYGAEEIYEGTNWVSVLEALEEEVSFAGHAETEASDLGPLYPMEVEVEVTDGTLTFGIRTNGTGTAEEFDFEGMIDGAGWFKVDNFQLFYLGQ